MVVVSFVYDEPTGKWEPIVDGAESELEAKQAFAAVVLTCRQLEGGLLGKAKAVKLTKYGIIPAV